MQPVSTTYPRPSRCFPRSFWSSTSNKCRTPSVWFTVIHYWRVADRWLLLISWSKQRPQSTVHFSLLWDLYTACAQCLASKPQVSEISAIRIVNFSFKLSQVPKLNFKQFPSSSKGGFIQFLIPHLLQDYLREMAIRAETLRHNRWEVRSFGFDWAGKRVGEGKMDGRTFGNGKMIYENWIKLKGVDKGTIKIEL